METYARSENYVPPPAPGFQPSMHANINYPPQPGPTPTYMNPSMQNIQMQPSQPTVQPNMGAPSANYYNQNQHQPFQILSDPMVTNMAMQYGSSLVGSGRQIVDSQFEKYIPVSRLKYYFAVDTNYVARKLMLVLFPFLHKDWSMKYEQNEPVQPKFEVNAPDLYIPVMAYVTYVLVAGLALGTQSKFSPEALGILASSALAWTVVEIVIALLTLYISSIDTLLKTLDLLAYSGYKFVGINLAVLLSLMLSRSGYYITLVYSSFAVAFFLVRTLKLQVLAGNDPYKGSVGNKRRMYFILFIAVMQPIMMWWLSSHLIPSS
ncbi:unnamed protein product [Bemisia tabaci]|nr:unnamed protein product [Bemisia tabaci]